MTTMKKQSKKAASLLKSLANPTRLMILCKLASGQQTVTELQRGLTISQTALSQHLARLRAEKIVTYRRQHRLLFYRLLNNDTRVIIKALYKIYCR